LILLSGLLVCGVRKQSPVFWVLLLAGIFFLVPALRAQMSEEEKKRLFLQAREDIRPVPKPSPAATPRPKPQPASTPRPTPKSTPRPQKAEEPEEEPTPKPTPKATPRSQQEGEPDEEPAPKPTPKSTPRPQEEKEPTPRPAPTTPEKEKGSDSQDVIDIPKDLSGEEREKPKPTPESKPGPVPAISPAQIPQGKTPQGRALDAPILVEKSGLEEDQGIEPAPKAQFGGLFKRYRYLTPAVRKAIDQARVQRGRWKYIIVHNSGTRQGNARVFDVYHRRVRKMQNGLAYHFVIGNGNSSGNGEIEIGSRWTRQINGGHVASDYLNNIALGICLVGDLNRDKPTKEQLAALDELITYLRSRVGKIKGKQAIVKGHKEINPKPTDCPGDRFPLGWLRQRFR